jgi:hypothetical protein
MIWWRWVMLTGTVLFADFSGGQILRQNFLIRGTIFITATL